MTSAHSRTAVSRSVLAVASASAAAALAVSTLAAPAAHASGGTMAVAPYYYNGWGSPPDPTAIMSATGAKWFTMAFVLSHGGCEPQWDGSRPLTGGVDQNTVNPFRLTNGSRQRPVRVRHECSRS